MNPAHPSARALTASAPDSTSPASPFHSPLASRCSTSAIFRPRPKYPRRIHFQMHLNISLVERVDPIPRAARTRPKRRQHTYQNSKANPAYPAHGHPLRLSLGPKS